MPDTDREARLEEIRENMELEYALISKAGAERALRDIYWLLSEIDRLREALHEVWAEIDFSGKRDELTGLTKINLTANEVELIRRALHEGEEDA